MDGNRDDQIRKRAHELWEQDGCVLGDDLKYWLAAERECREQRDEILDEGLEETFPASDPPASTMRSGKDAA